MLGCLGDLVEDVVVRLSDSIHIASDTDATIRRRRGGSAANVAAAAAAHGYEARFIGQVGNDPTGDLLVADLTRGGVEVVGVRSGRTGTVVALVDPSGERSMLTDRGASVLLSTPDRSWIEGLGCLHVPFYSLVVEPLAFTATTLIAWAHEWSVPVSIDVSSVSVVEAFGVDSTVSLLGALAPQVLLANRDEAACLGSDGLGRIGAPITVVKQGPDPVLIHEIGRPVEAVAAEPLGAAAADTTGAGDAFAAGFLTAMGTGATAAEAAHQGHRFAAWAIQRASNSE